MKPNPKVDILDHQVQMFNSSLGFEILQLLNDDSVVEIMRNPDGGVWVDRHGSGEVFIGNVQSDADAKRTVELVAHTSKRICNREFPIVSGEIPGTGHRFQGLVPPVVETPTWTIRKKPSRVFTLDNYVSSEIISEEQRDKIIEAVWNRKNIMVVGPTQSGKTTFVNAILEESSKTKQRHILIEDTYELQCTAKNKVMLRSSESVQMNDLLAATMRLNPTRIVVGEVKRGMEAYTLLMAWNTGHPGGICTIHANSAKEALYRIEELLQEAGIVPVPRSIARAVNVIVFIEPTANGRRVREIVEVKGYQNDYILEAI